MEKFTKFEGREVKIKKLLELDNVLISSINVRGLRGKEYLIDVSGYIPLDFDKKLIKKLGEFSFEDEAKELTLKQIESLKEFKQKQMLRYK